MEQKVIPKLNHIYFTYDLYDPELTIFDKHKIMKRSDVVKNYAIGWCNGKEVKPSTFGLEAILFEDDNGEKLWFHCGVKLCKNIKLESLDIPPIGNYWY